MKFKSTLLLTFFVTLTIQNEPLEEFLLNKNPPLNIKMLDRAVFEDITYENFIEESENLVKDDSLVRRYSLEKKYPWVSRSTCGEKMCETYMYELTNFASTLESIRSRPVILLVAGMHGSATLGIRILLRTIKVFQKLYMYRKKWFRILNNVRLLVIPVINMGNFYENEDREVSTHNGAIIEFDPMLDFNFYPEATCFHTTSSQYLFYIFEEYLIYAGLILTKGNFEIDFPNLKSLKEITMTFPDETMYMMMANKLMNVFNFNTMDGIPEMSIADNNFESYFERHARKDNPHGTFLEWAYAGSHFKKDLSTKCLQPNSSFKHNYKQINDSSNRAFVMELKLSKDIIKGDLQKVMGNELFLFDSHHEDAIPGIIPLGVILVRQMIEYIRPSVSLVSMKLEKDDAFNPLDISMQMVFNISGCPFYKDTKMISPKPTESEELEETEKIVEASSIQLKMKFDFRKEQLLTLSKKYDFELKIDCESKMDFTRYSAKTALSHFINQQFSKEQLFKKGNYIYPANLNSYKITNLRLREISKNMVFEKKFNESIIMSTNSILVSLGNMFPIRVFYDFEESSVDFEVLKNKEFEKKITGEKRYFFSGTGILNHAVNFNYCETTFQYYNMLPTADDLELKFFTDYMSFVCSKVDIDRIFYKHLSLNKMKDQILQIDYRIHDFDKEKNQKNHDLKKKLLAEREDLNNKYKIGLQADPCYRFFRNSSNGGKDQLYFLKINKYKKTRILPTLFILLLGKYVNVSYKNSLSDPSQEPPIPEGLKDLKFNFKKYEMAGPAVRIDIPITGQGTDESPTPRLPLYEKYRTFGSLEKMGYNPSKLFCTSTSPIFRISDQTLEVFKSKNNHVKNFKRFFQAIQVSHTVDGPKFGTVWYYTTNAQAPDTVLLATRTASIPLKRANTMVQLNGDYIKYKNEILTYSAPVNLEEVPLSFSFVFIQDTEKNISLFDCFLSTLTEEKPVQDFFMIHKDIELNTNDYYINSKAFYIWISIIAFVLVLGVGGFFLNMFIQWKKEEKKKLEEKLN